MVATLVETLTPALNDAIVSAGIDIDGANGNKVIYTQYTGLIIHNTDTGSLTATITSKADSRGFSKTISKAIAGSSYCIVNFLDENFQVDGEINITWTGTTPAGKILPVRFELGR